MANYKEVTLSGTGFVRSNRIVIDHPLDASVLNRPPGVVPLTRITFDSELAVPVGEAYVVSPIERYLSAVFEPNGTYPEINPETGEPTGGTCSHAALYVMLHSLFIHVATTQDAADALVKTPAP